MAAIFIFFVALVAPAVMKSTADFSSADEFLASCRNKQGVSVFNDSNAVGDWHLLNCYIGKNANCNDNNSMNFSVIEPQKRKSLSEQYSAQMPGVAWDAVVLQILSPHSSADKSGPIGTSYMERMPTGFYRLIDVPKSSKDTKVPKPRRVRLELLMDQFLLMLDCEDEEVIVLARRPPPAGYKLDPVTKSLVDSSLQD